MNGDADVAQSQSRLRGSTYLFPGSKHFPAVTLLFETLPEGFPGHRMAEEDQSENEYIEFALHSELKTAVDALQRAERDWRAELEVMMPK